MNVLYELLIFALPGGFLSGVATYALTRRKRRNDLLAEMQQSIDLLGSKYNDVLQDNVDLRGERVEWLVAQKELQQQIDQLTAEIAELKKLLAHDEKNPLPVAPRRGGVRRPTKNDDSERSNHAVAPKRKSTRRTEA